MSATVIIGRNAVKQFLNSDQHIEKLFIREREKTNKDLNDIIKLARQKGVQVQWLKPYKFDDRFEGDHQGIACMSHNFKQLSIMLCCPRGFPESSLHDILQTFTMEQP